MRIELSGSLVHVDPLTIVFTQDQDFLPEVYTALGYTHFEAICIGGGGGSGGGIDTANTGTQVRNYGGKGGGGGFHRARGLLSTLASPCPVAVGLAGADGADHASLPASVGDGLEGGFSSFNDNTCIASGGRGGKGADSNSTTVSTVANGGDGGLGDRSASGGGGAGGLAGTPTALGPGTPGTDGEDGSLNGDIGAGGGGGAGGVGNYESDGGGLITGITCVSATAGGRGSYNPGYTLVYGPGGDPTTDPDSLAASIVPGNGGGAKDSPLSGLPTVHGQSGQDGIVIIRLTSE